jgi:hypothetical protein
MVQGQRITFVSDISGGTGFVYFYTLLNLLTLAQLRLYGISLNNVLGKGFQSGTQWKS